MTHGKEPDKVIWVGSEEEEKDEIIWMTVDEVAGGSSQSQKEGEDAGGKRKRQEEQEEEQEEPMFRRRKHGGNKIKNWSLRPERPVLILGDSNMVRLPRIMDNRVQVECYPGAHWFHAQEILRNRTPTTDWVATVVLSFGINDRGGASAERVGKALRQTLRVAKSTFPNAGVFIPVVNFNRHLPKRQCVMLNQINSHITSTGRALEVLPYESFKTEQDF